MGISICIARYATLCHCQSLSLTHSAATAAAAGTRKHSFLYLPEKRDKIPVWRARL